VIDEAMQTIDCVQVDDAQVHVPLESPALFGGNSSVARDTTAVLELLLARARCEREARHKGEYPTYFHGEELRALFEDATHFFTADGLRATIQGAARFPASSWPKPPGYQLRERGLDRDRWAHPDLLVVWRALEGIAGDDPKTRARAVRKHGTLEIVATDKGAHFEVRRRVPIHTGKHMGVVMLDATGRLTKGELQAANPRTPIEEFGLKVRPDPAARIRRLLIQTNSVRRKHLVEEGKLTPRGLGTIRNVLRQAEAGARAHIDGPLSTCSLITYKDVEVLLQSEKELLGSVTPRGLHLVPERMGHYWCDERGSNRFTGTQVHVTFGEPIQNLGALWADARALGLDAAKLASARTAATLVQAQGRSRALRAKGPVLLVHVGSAAPADWVDYTTVSLPAGRPPAPIRETVTALVRGLLEAGEIVAVPIIRALLGAQIPLPDPLAKTALKGTVESSFGQSPLPAGRTLTRCVSAAAKRRGVQISVAVGNAKWMVWKPAEMAEGEASARAVVAWGRLQAAAAAASPHGEGRCGVPSTGPGPQAVPTASAAEPHACASAADPVGAEDSKLSEEVFEERAAVLEFQAGLGRAEAERRARQEAAQVGQGDRPDSHGADEGVDRACA
jgi:hypothetical protein